MHDLLQDLVLLLQLLNEALLLLTLLGQSCLPVFELLNEILLALPEPPLGGPAVQGKRELLTSW